MKQGVREVNWSQFRNLAQTFPNRSALKRLGFLIETLGKGITEEGRKVLDEWQAHLSEGVVPLEPGGRTTGKINTRWRVQVNADVA